MRLVLASSNRGKIAEFSEYLKSTPVQLILQHDLNIEEAEETGGTFIENAMIKARHATRLTGMPALADDSGLVVDALDGAPGIYSSRYAPDDASRIAKLLNALQGVPDEKRTAHFYCALVYLEHTLDPVPHVFLGEWFGRILHNAVGSHGFGYDPVFYVPEKNCSAAQLEPDVKNAMSHRAQAIRGLKAFLSSQSKLSVRRSATIL